MDSKILNECIKNLEKENNELEKNVILYKNEIERKQKLIQEINVIKNTGKFSFFHYLYVLVFVIFGTFWFLALHFFNGEIEPIDILGSVASPVLVGLIFFLLTQIEDFMSKGDTYKSTQYIWFFCIFVAFYIGSYLYILKQ